MAGFERRAFIGGVIAYIVLMLLVACFNPDPGLRFSLLAAGLPAFSIAYGLFAHHVFGCIRSAIDHISFDRAWTEYTLSNSWRVYVKETWGTKQLIVRFTNEIRTAFDGAKTEERGSHKLLLGAGGLIQCLGGDPRQPCPVVHILYWSQGRLLPGLCVDDVLATAMHMAIEEHRKAQWHAKAQSSY